MSDYCSDSELEKLLPSLTSADPITEYAIKLKEGICQGNYKYSQEIQLRIKNHGFNWKGNIPTFGDGKCSIYAIFLSLPINNISSICIILGIDNQEMITSIETLVKVKQKKVITDEEAIMFAFFLKKIGTKVASYVESKLCKLDHITFDDSAYTLEGIQYIMSFLRVHKLQIHYLSKLNSLARLEYKSDIHYDETKTIPLIKILHISTVDGTHYSGMCLEKFIYSKNK